MRESCRERSRRSKSNSRDYRNERYEGGRHRNEGRRYGEYADRDEERYFRSNDNHYNYNRKLSDPPIWGQHDTFSGWKRRVLIWDEEKEKPERKANMLMESLSKNEHHKEVIELVRQAVIENEAFNWKSYSVVDKILKIIENEVEESMWTRNMNVSKELMSLKTKCSIFRGFQNLKFNSRTRKRTYQTCFWLVSS